MNEIYADALQTYGAVAQINQTIEECAELIVSLRHWSRTRATADDVASEIADVTIMCEQMRLLFGPSLVDDCVKAKQLRLAIRLANKHVVDGLLVPSVPRNARERVS